MNNLLAIINQGDCLLNIFTETKEIFLVVTVMRGGHLQLVLVGIARSARWPGMSILSHGPNHCPTHSICNIPFEGVRGPHF